MKTKIYSRICLLAFWLLAASAIAFAQNSTPSVLAIFEEVSDYVKEKSKILVGQGKRVDAEKREDLKNEQKSLAKKRAAEAAARSDLKGVEFYYLASLYEFAGDEEKTLETMRRFLAQYPSNVKGDAIQSARGYVAIYSAKLKQFAEAEQAFDLWLKGEPAVPKQRPAIEQSLAVSYFKNGKYEEAIRHGEAAFEKLKALEAATLAERRAKTDLYANLVEVLALSYRKNKNNDRALEVLAEARALSFTIPSARLYRRVMDFVGGSGFSEKRLMQKVESYQNAAAAPEMAIQEWLGQNAVTLESLRGKIVLLDFWATWCGPCLATFPRLRSWHKKYAENGLTIIGVTQFYGRAENKPLTELQEIDYLADFKKKHKLPYGFAVSRYGEANSKYDIAAYPTTVLLDRNGVIRYIGIGAGLEESENLEEMIEKLFKETAQTAVNTKQPN